MTGSILQTLVLILVVVIVLAAFWRYASMAARSAESLPDRLPEPEEDRASPSGFGTPEVALQAPPPSSEAPREWVIAAEDPLAVDVTTAIQQGNVGRLNQLLAEHPGLARARIAARDATRTLLHVVTDWPGHFPSGAATVVGLVAAGADVNAQVTGPHAETPLHWAASSNDLEVLDALIDAGADTEMAGSVIDGGPPLADAVAFGQWRAAYRLVERGARTSLWQAAALGLMHRVNAYFDPASAPSPEEVTNAFWFACHGGQQPVAEFLLERGADLNWVGHNGLTPLDAAERSHAAELVEWLRSRGARSSSELGV